MYDSTCDTLVHKTKVKELLNIIIRGLKERGEVHDDSKLLSPEKEYFDRYTPLLKEQEYGSPEYIESLKNLKVALEHHYKNNSHHPEAHKNGIRGMNILDLNEMFADWKASGLRQKNGDLRQSIIINQERFGYSDDIKQILLNSVELFEGFR